MSGHQKGRKVRDRADARRLFKRCEKSGLSLSDFCLRYGINLRSLAAHRRYVQDEAQVVEASDFVAVTIATPVRVKGFETQGLKK